MTTPILNIEQSWSVLEPLLTIRDEVTYQRSLEQLNGLIDLVGTDEQHSLYSLLDTLGILIEAYETEHVEIPEASGVDALQYLMEEHNLTPDDLPEIGSQDKVTEILSGKRDLNVQQIRTLSQRFQVSPAVFI
jgi:HTH-type transcriptional regulator/antitoxin HigA